MPPSDGNKRFAFGRLWTVDSILIFRNGAEKDRPAASVRECGSRRTFVVPGSTRYNEGENVVVVRANEGGLRSRTYFLPGFIKHVSNEELWGPIGMLPNKRKDKLRERIRQVLLREYGINPLSNDC